MSHERIRTMADEGRFSKQIAEQLITAGCPAGLAWRTFTVADGRGLSIAAAFAFVKNETAPTTPAPQPAPAAAAKPVATAPRPAVQPNTRIIRQQAAVPPKPPVDTWNAAIAAVHAEFGFKVEPAK